MWCAECEQEMENDYEVKMQGAPLMAFFKIQKGKEIKKVKAAFCPKCKKIIWYAE